MGKSSSKKTKLGRMRGRDYVYKTSLDLTDGNLLDQIDQWDEEEKIISKIEKEKKKLEKSISAFKTKSKNLKYYFVIGKKLQFIEKPAFKNVAPHSIFRIVYEIMPSILPKINSLEVGQKHIRGMFYLGKVDENDLPRAKWSQWYEITKFPHLFTSKKLYRRVLKKFESKKLSGPELRKEIRDIINKNARESA